MATAIIFAKNRECARRKALLERQKDHEKLVADVLKSWDKSHTGTLSYDELKAWLTSMNQGAPPSDAECMWVMRMAIDKTPGMDMVQDLTQAHVTPKYFGRAAQSWLAYQETKSEINAVFKKFDTDSSDSLDRAQLKQVLTALNDGGDPADEELDYVLKRADVIGSGNITKPELAMAISLWYTLEEQHNMERSSFLGTSSAPGGVQKEGSAKKMEPVPEGKVAPNKVCGACAVQ
uniref:EF-hand domain-containing protein n=1 Tax=Hemiselmis andersenii TaxID=464988 RepID=A0A6U4KF53_HEMAN|mmetsp:Transcript_8935/g.20843  ORF Transcript_8935/g.20843 Transcript_8935/m.20843 type:complete len:234 (+) Transcript_8935:198-899(+)